MYASRSGNAVLIEFLIQMGADVNERDDNDWTALTHAANRGNIKCVQKLLNNNADPLLYTNSFFYPHDLALKSGFVDVIF